MGEVIVRKNFWRYIAISKTGKYILAQIKFTSVKVIYVLHKENYSVPIVTKFTTSLRQKK